MTTIVYDHKNGVIACESRQTQLGLIMSDGDVKCSRIDGELYVGSGNIQEISDLTHALRVCDTAIDAGNDAQLFYTRDGKVRGCCADNGNVVNFDVTTSDSLGSGGLWALAAMDFGCTAKEAVKYAITRDIYSGGKVHVYKIPNSCKK